MYLTIYLIGFILVWIFMKFARIHNPDYNNWYFIFMSFVMSLCSWVIILIIILTLICLELQDRFKIKEMFKKPPKWL